jgi:2-polyprenyl-3-methyl-5-hydroxy-6-metoxy-1,4-benzoquinol methylase
MNDEFDKKTSSYNEEAKFGILKYWLSELPDLYNYWYNWFENNEPAKTISEIVSQYSGKDKSQLKILDCACGTGNPSLSLTKNGFKVCCSDGSAKMLEIAQNNAIKSNIQLQIINRPVLWEQLVEYFDNKRFNVVLCTGNSLCHLPPEGVAEAIRQMAYLLEKEGLLLVDTKRYNNQMQELEYKADQGWYVRKQRLDTRTIHGKNASLTTTLSYEGKDESGRKYQVQLDLRIGHDIKKYIFSVWAITSKMIQDNMKEAGLNVFPLYEARNLLEWKYDFCIGKNVG